jgi:AcrR family transcriptional regulator
VGAIRTNDRTEPSPAPTRTRTNARGDATRELILLAAERLFAERGIEAVPLRDVRIAAGQRNSAAVQYHFGDRETLVRAIAAHRAADLERMSSKLIADAVVSGETPTIEDMVRAFVLALAANLDNESNFLPFLSRYIIERGNSSELDSAAPAGWAEYVRTIMSRLLPHLTDDVLGERWQVLLTSAVHTLARYQVARRLGTLPAPMDDLLDDLVYVLTGGLEAPVGDRRHSIVPSV